MREAAAAGRLMPRGGGLSAAGGESGEAELALGGGGFGPGLGARPQLRASSSADEDELE